MIMTIDRLNKEIEEFPVMITDIPGKGRGLVAKPNIFAGTVLLREKPKILVRAEENIISVVESALLQLLGMPQKVFNEVLMNLSCMYPANQTSFKTEPTERVNKFEADMLNFISEKLIDSNSIPPAKMLKIRNILGRPTDSANIMLLLVILRLTMIGIFDEWETEKVGEALVVITSFINHSCYPNTSLFFHPVTYECEIRANRDIANGEEILFTYTALYQYTEERRHDLMYNYGFLCDCPRCVSNPSCPSQLDLTPPIIQTHLSDKLKYEKSEFLEQLYHESENLYYMEHISGDSKHSESIKIANKWLNEAKNFYAPLHPYIFKITEFLGRVCCEVGEYKNALKYYEETVQIMDMVFPKFWFRKSFALGCLGKLYRYLGQIENARRIENRRRQLLLTLRGKEDWDDGSDDFCTF